MTFTASTIQIVVAAVTFALALLHTFSLKQLERFPSHAGVFHLLGEGGIVFGLCGIVFFASRALIDGAERALSYAESRNFAVVRDAS